MLKTQKRVVIILCFVAVIVIAVFLAVEIFDSHDGKGRHHTPEQQAVIDEASVKFSQYTYEDIATGHTIEYSLFVPDAYDNNKEYPIVMFIPDLTGSKKSAKEITDQFYGACIWAVETEQEKHECFVFVPAFSEKITSDDWFVSDQLIAAFHALTDLQKEYRIDPDRIYTTGQSMGCMASLYLNSKYPDFFAASIYVSGQWDISVLKPLKNQKFFYIVAAGDQKASTGQRKVMEMFDESQTAYTYSSWSAAAPLVEQNTLVENMLIEQTNHYMVSFEKGTVLQEIESDGNEHMDSFNYVYQLSAVRDWLFEQSKS